MRPNSRPLLALGTATLSVTLAAGCAGGSGGDAIQVTASDTACEVSRTEFPAGHVTLSVQNTGSQVTEVYVYAPGDQIVTERENITPGLVADIVAEIKPGSYEIACKPGMKGRGIRQKVTVTGSGAKTAARDPRLDKAVADYRAYVLTQAEETIPLAQAFVDAVKAGDVAKAKAAYAPSRIGWERTEPVAESFGDIDPKVDLREDGLEPNQKWTGWHRLEKSLWVTGSISAEDKAIADQLMVDLKDWQQRVGRAEITPTSIANGAKELLDEVATGKVTGEEERYSHTDLVDFVANVEGARTAYELLRPVVVAKDAQLATTLDSAFRDLAALLATYRSGDGYVSYDTVDAAARRKLSDGVNALGEPLSKLAAAVAR